MIKVLIADDHTIVRKGLEQILEETSDLTVAGQAKNGHQVIEKISKDHFDVVVLDISMPGRNGLDILKQIKSIQPKLPILILSMYPEDQYAKRVLKAGAQGYISKESATEQLVTAIRRVAGGRKYITANLAEKLASDLEKDHTGLPHEKLSDREFQVMCMIAAGKTVSAIADELALSVKTISTNRTRILEKMNLKNNAEIICYAVKNNLVNLDL